MKNNLLKLNDLFSLTKCTDIKAARNLYHNLYRDAIREAKITANENYIKQAHNKTQAMWSTINAKRSDKLTNVIKSCNKN